MAGAKAARGRREYVLAERMARASSARERASRPGSWRPTPRTRGRHEQAASEVDGLARLAAGTSEHVQISLVRFDHEFFLYGTADMTAIDASLATDLDPVWRDELGPGACASTVTLGNRGP